MVSPAVLHCPLTCGCPPTAPVNYPPVLSHLAPHPPSGLFFLTPLRKALVPFLGSLHSGNLLAPGRNDFWGQECQEVMGWG